MQRTPERAAGWWPAWRMQASLAPSQGEETEGVARMKGRRRLS